MRGGERDGLGQIDFGGDQGRGGPQRRVDARTTQIGPVEFEVLGAGTGEVGAMQVCLAHIGAHQVGLTETAVRQIHLAQIEPSERRQREVGFGELRRPHPTIGERGAQQAALPELRMP